MLNKKFVRKKWWWGPIFSRASAIIVYSKWSKVLFLLRISYFRNTNFNPIKFSHLLKKKKLSHQFCKINLHATLLSLSLSLSTFPLSDSATTGLYNSGNLWKARPWRGFWSWCEDQRRRWSLSFCKEDQFDLEDKLFRSKWV